MTYPLRFTVCTANLWGETFWPQRQEVLHQFLDLHRPDLLCVQELSSVARQLIEQTLPGHSRVEADFPGWLTESNIFWNMALFELAEYGAEEIGQLEELRRLFWVRLLVKDEKSPPLTVATVHYSWPGSEAEKQDGLNRRFLQAQRTVERLNRLTGPEDRLLFMGDFNEYYHPLNILRGAGLQDCFSALGRIPAPTYAVYSYKKRSAEVLDWLLQRGPLQPMTAEVVDFYAGGYALSDHRPILATYRLL